MKKLAIIGASELQNPLIEKAREKGFETHVFAWRAGDVGERTADVFHAISIVEKDAILEECRRIGIDGICTIASDLANVTVGHVACALGLVGNSPECVAASTNKRLMRECFARAHSPSPRSRTVREGMTFTGDDLSFPVIVKPTDRSGSRGVTKVLRASDLPAALAEAFEVSFDGCALVEDFATGDEFSIECFSWEGAHTLCAVTKKYTTGAPHFIERGHEEPSGLSVEVVDRLRAVVFSALDALGVRVGASHAEVKIDPSGAMNIIEIGSRMGGDCIGSDLVPLTTGIDYVGAVVDAAVGHKPDLDVHPERACGNAAVRYLFDEDDVALLERVRNEHPSWLVKEDCHPEAAAAVSDSSTRWGFFVVAGGEALREAIPALFEDGKKDSWSLD